MACYMLCSFLVGNITSYGMLCAVFALIPVLAMVCCELDGKDKWTIKENWKDKTSDVSWTLGWLLKNIDMNLGKNRQNY